MKKSLLKDRSVSSIIRRKRKKKRFFFYRADIPKRIYLIFGASLTICIWVIATVTAYGIDYFQSKHTSSLLQQEYHQGAEVQVDEWISPVASSKISEESRTDADQPNPMITATPYVTPNASIMTTTQPGNNAQNHFRTVNESISRLRKRNEDIIGWLNIEGVVDEAVVQRDNTYYLDRDYLGYHNVNGALFLDERCDLFKQPNTLIIYGHNMKNGSMFGTLHNYEKLSFYKEHAFILCTTLYEESTYVIAAVSRVSVLSGSVKNAEYQRLAFCGDEERSLIVDHIFQLSKYTPLIDITNDDDILILSTCIGGKDERLLILARRMRDDEDVAMMKNIVSCIYPQ